MLNSSVKSKNRFEKEWCHPSADSRLHGNSIYWNKMINKSAFWLGRTCLVSDTFLLPCSESVINLPVQLLCGQVFRITGRQKESVSYWIGGSNNILKIWGCCKQGLNISVPAGLNPFFLPFAPQESFSTGLTSRTWIVDLILTPEPQMLFQVLHHPGQVDFTWE